MFDNVEQPSKPDSKSNRDAGKLTRVPSSSKKTSAKQRKQHAHNAPVRRAASKARG
jgi:hypothetical protein